MPKHKEKVPKDELIELKKQGKTVEFMAKHFCVSEWKICKMLDLYGYTDKKRHEQQLRRLPELAKDHTMLEMAEELDVDYETIRRYLKKLGIKPISGRRHHYKHVDIEYAIKQLNAGVTKEEVARQLNISPITLTSRLREAGLDKIITKRPRKKQEKKKPQGTRCERSVMDRCIYGSGNCCVYILIEGHRRPCTPEDCTCFKKGTISEKRKLHEKML